MTCWASIRQSSRFGITPSAADSCGSFFTWYPEPGSHRLGTDFETALSEAASRFDSSFLPAALRETETFALSSFIGISHFARERSGFVLCLVSFDITGRLSLGCADAGTEEVVPDDLLLLDTVGGGIDEEMPIAGALFQ